MNFFFGKSNNNTKQVKYVLVYLFDIKVELLLLVRTSLMVTWDPSSSFDAERGGLKYEYSLLIEQKKW